VAAAATTSSDISNTKWGKMQNNKKGIQKTNHIKTKSAWIALQSVLLNR